MGDRANVYVKDGNSGVYLYTHWTGTKLPGVVQSALRRGESRWNDGQYLARVIFNEMTRGDEDGVTGFGISSVLCDNNHPIIVVDTSTETVGLADEGDEILGIVQADWPFADFVALDTAGLDY